MSGVPGGDPAREPRGQWVVVVRDILGNEDTLVGPFTVEERANALARRLSGDFAARGAEEVLEAVVKWLRPGVEATDLREELLADLENSGYAFVPSEVRRGLGFNESVGF